MRKSLPLLWSATLLLAVSALAAEKKDNAKPADTKAARDNYPLTTCVVSDDKLTEMGKPVEYVWREAGKPDRLVMFCCKDCIKDFEKEPAKYLKKIDDAAAAKAVKKS